MNSRTHNANAQTQSYAGPSAGSIARARRRVLSRVSMACERCRQRKIRCDGQTPSCRTCQKANLSCVFEQRGNVRSVAVTPNANISQLENAQTRIRWLENELRRLTSLQQPTATVDSGEMNPALVVRSPAEPIPQPSEPQSSEPEQRALAHEIGLVSLMPGSEARYIGPSSGFFFARKILGNINRKTNTDADRRKTEQARSQLNEAIANDVDSITSFPLPSTVDLCKSITAHYFRTTHIEFPFMHEGQQMAMIDKFYDGSDTSALPTFQLNMVLAIASADLRKRLKVLINPDGYFSNAKKILEKISTAGSLKGLQCLLLLVIFATSNPHTGLNAWFLHYETIASVIDLGLQRDVSRLAIPLQEQEMRTRIFWVVYSLDRRLATMMGRPIGLRDEACELRFPLNVEDAQLEIIARAAEVDPDHVSHLTWATQLFKLAQLNSEIKYVLHSISKESGHYSFSPVPDVLDWQQGMIRRLEEWSQQVTSISEKGNKEDDFLVKDIWLQRYYDLMILLLWPSPAIRAPHESIMLKCYHSAMSSLSLLLKLYQGDNLVYNTTTIHSVFVGSLTMLYCLGAVANIANTLSQPVDDIEILYLTMNILTSLAEHWPECRKARDGLMHVAKPIIQKTLQQRGYRLHPSKACDASDAESSRAFTANRSQSYSQHAAHGQPSVFDDFMPSADSFNNSDFFMAQFEGFSAFDGPFNESFVDPLLSLL